MAYTVYAQCPRRRRHHAMVLDGVFARDAEGVIGFHCVPAHPAPDLTPVLVTIAGRLQRLLARRGVSDGSDDASTGLKVGLRVRHKQFGIGNIIGVEEQGDDTRVTVRFNAVGVKKLVERYAALEKA